MFAVITATVKTKTTAVAITNNRTAGLSAADFEWITKV